MLDIRLLREDSENVKKRLATRGEGYTSLVDDVLAIDIERRAAETQLQKLNSDRKRLSKEIGSLRSKGEPSDEIEAQVKGFAAEISALNEASGTLDTRQRELLLQIPNLPHVAVPIGQDASANPEIRHHGQKDKATTAICHTEICEKLHLLESERAVKISGSGFTCFSGAGARLERALIQFLLNLHTDKHGYREISPPFLVRRESMIGTGQLPKFEEDMYAVGDSELFLAPTAEVPVTNLRREEILAIDDLPIKYVAYTPCFRREAGSAGKENRGLIRMHQFDKVELVRLAHPEQSENELEILTHEAEAALELLGLHYRVIELCSGDLGFSSTKTYDIEVWAPGQKSYLEVSSCSNFGDYQARRMGLRFKDNDGKNKHCHTLNGSGTALPRLFVALVETYYDPHDHKIHLPEVLHGIYGAETIG
ncbi:MAG: serine--tRNA ligase [Chthoniobacterales bacterium]